MEPRGSSSEDRLIFTRSICMPFVYVCVPSWAVYACGLQVAKENRKRQPIPGAGAIGVFMCKFARTECALNG